jgi:ATP-dependent Clp protease ATP-binding subunit ClpC
LFERFTDRARRVVVLAQEEARLLAHNFIGTEHILLGLIHEGEGVAAQALEALGVRLDAAREAVGRRGSGRGSPPTSQMPFTPRAKKVLELSLREALQLGHNYIGTEHVLLGLVAEGEGVGAQVLREFGAELPAVRRQVMERLDAPGVATPPPPDPPTCHGCGASLLNQIGSRAMAATDDAGVRLQPILVVYCRSCGRSLGVLPGSPPES